VCSRGSYADTFFTNAAVKTYFGDMNGDKEFTPHDFSALVNASLDGSTLTDDVLKTVADVNMDGTVDVLDCRLVKLLSQGKELPA
jgi:hypothetical protein